jgi:hypothetical protein
LIHTKSTLFLNNAKTQNYANQVFAKKLKFKFSKLDVNFAKDKEFNCTFKILIGFMKLFL